MLKKERDQKMTGSYTIPRAVRIVLAVAGGLAFFLFLYFYMYVVDFHFSLQWFANPDVLAVVFGAPLILLLVTGLFPDFWRSFVYCVKREEDITILQVKKSLFSVKLAMVTALAADLLSAIYRSVVIMVNVSNDSYSSFESFFPVLIWLIGSLIYGVIVVLLLLPVYARLKVRLLSMQG